MVEGRSAIGKNYSEQPTDADLGIKRGADGVVSYGQYGIIHAIKKKWRKPKVKKELLKARAKMLSPQKEGETYESYAKRHAQEEAIYQRMVEAAKLENGYTDVDVWRMERQSGWDFRLSDEERAHRNEMIRRDDSVKKLERELGQDAKFRKIANDMKKNVPGANERFVEFAKNHDPAIIRGAINSMKENSVGTPENKKLMTEQLAKTMTSLIPSGKI